jgi:hypothetical protein
VHVSGKADRAEGLLCLWDTDTSLVAYRKKITLTWVSNPATDERVRIRKTGGKETQPYITMIKCSGPDSHNEQTPALKVPLQTGLRFRSRGYEQPPYQEARGTTNSEWLAAARSDSSGNDLRLGRQDSCSNGFRADAAAERLSPTKDENQPSSQGEWRSRGAGGVGDLVGRETFSGCCHLNTASAGAGRPKAHR